MLAMPAMPAALADVESDHLENYANQKWWVGKGLDVGDIFIYKICDPDTFSGLYGGQPWEERCYYLSLHFVTLLLGDSGPEWIVQVMTVSEFGDRQYDVYNIDGKTMRINGLTDERKVALAVQNTIFGLTEFTNRGAQALIVGEQWGTVKSVSSPAIKFVVRDIMIDDNDREVFLAGYTTTATSIHRITINEPFPLSAEVYNSHRLLPAADRIYDYDLILAGNSLRDDFDYDGWFDKLDSLDVGVFLEFPSQAPDPGAGIVDFCAITPPDADHLDEDGYDEFVENVVDTLEIPDQEFVDVAEFDEFVTEGATEADILIEEFGSIDAAVDEAVFAISGVSAVEYCIDLFASDGLTVVPVTESEFELEADAIGLSDENIDDLPGEEFQPNDAGTPGIIQPGLDMSEPVGDDSDMAESSLPDDIPPEATVPEDEAPVNDVAPINETQPVEIIPVEPAPPKDDDIIADLANGITGFFDEIVEFFVKIGDMLGELAVAFITISMMVHVMDAVPDAHAQSDKFDDAYGKLLDSIKSNNTEAEQIGFAQLLKLIVQEETEDDDSIIAEGNFVWIPTKMIEGLEYEGIVLLDNAARAHRTVILASSDLDVLSVEREVIVPAGRNSAIFGITAHVGGPAKVYAAMGGEALASEDGTVYEINTEPHQIVLITPNSGGSVEETVFVQDVNFPSENNLPGGTVAGSSGTVVNADTVPVFAYLLDQNGAPTISETDTVLHMGASAGINVPETITIQAGDTHAKFVAGVDRDGTIHAASTGLLPYTVDIGRVVDDIDVRFAVVPTVVAKGSTAHYYVWLEKDGQPYKPKQVIDVRLTSSDRSVAGLSAAHTDVELAGYVGVSSAKDRATTIQMNDGFARGMIHAGERGAATLSASVPQYGTAFYGVHVGATSISDTALCSENDEDDGISLKKKNPTDMIVWLMPQVTDSVAYAVVAQYSIMNVEAEGEEPGQADASADRAGPDTLSLEDQEAFDLFSTLVSLSQGGLSAGSGEEGCVAFPVPFSEQFITVSSDGGAIHDGIYDTLHRHGTMDTVIEFPIEFLTTGEHTVRVIGNEIGEFEETEDLFGSWTDGFAWESTITVEDAYVGEYSLGLTALPFDSEGLDEVAIVHLQDGQGSMVDINSVHLRTRDLVVSQASEDFEISRYGNVFVLSAGLNKTDGVAISTASLAPVSANIVPSDEIVGTHVDVPAMVHSGEEFPYVIHEINSDGVPLKKIGEPDVSLGDGVVQSSGGRLVTEDADVTGTITVIGTGEPVTETIDVNKNELDFNIELEPEDARVGEPVLLRLISDIGDIDYTIDWPRWLDYEKTGEDENSVEYTITPNSEDNGTIRISGGKQGYVIERNEVSLSAIHEINFDTRSESDGKIIAAAPEVTDVGDDSKVDVPYVGPPVFVHVKYPIEYVSSVGEGYLFRGAEINGSPIDLSEFELNIDKDVRVIGNYERQIFIDIVDADGSGVYRTGDEAYVYAPDREKFLFFITDVFSHWEGDLAGRGPGPFTIIAENDLYSKAVYVEDHSVWMGIVLAAVAAVAVLSIFRKSDRLKWMFSGLSGLNKMKPKMKMKKKKKIMKASEFEQEAADEQ